MGCVAADPEVSRPGDRELSRTRAPGRRLRSAQGAVRVDAPARLQMGLIDLRGDLGRRFGGVGVAVEEPRTVLEVEAAPQLEVEGLDAERVASFARRFLEFHSLGGGARIRALRAIPAHVGLGSGTQLALAAARGLAELHGLPSGVRALASAVRRGARSAVGSWTFERGGLVVDGGLRTADPNGARGLAPLIGRYPVPERWRCVIVIPPVAGGLSGEDERAAFARLPAPPPDVVGRISHLLLMGILPSVLEEDLASFGRALHELQLLVGSCFAPVQGSTYAGPEVADVIRRLSDAGAVGAGQSSWGPTAYGFVEGTEAAEELATRARGWMDAGGRAWATALDNRGARVSRI